ncbi:MAG TPA: APC family permease [Thermoanaerobaculia bacterium]|nr:APC family permease [Thermoanaerobaculia bacterium]
MTGGEISGETRTRATSTSEKLVRAVGFWGLVAMCINAVVGSGVFLLPSESYKLLGPFSLWAPLIFALPVFILVLCFAEAASHFREPGGAYLYARTAFGEFIGFETGWMNWLARVTSLASLSNGFVVALALLFPVAGQGAPRAAIIVGLIVSLAVIHFIGVRYGAASIYLFTWGKLLPLLAFIVVSLIVFRQNPIPGSLTLPPAGTDWNSAALFMLFAYAGFENLGVPAGEYKNPQRHLPWALLTGILCIAIIYVLAQLGAMASLPDLSSTDTAIASAAQAIVGPAGAILVTVGSILSMAGTNSGTMLEGSRMLYALSLERPRLRFISAVHDRFRTPSAAIAIHATLALAIALFSDFATLAKFSAVARLATYLFTAASVPFLRRKLGTAAGFRLPGGPVIPILGVLVALLIVVTLDRTRLLLGAIAVVLGVIVYVAAPRTAAGSSAR